MTMAQSSCPSTDTEPIRHDDQKPGSVKLESYEFGNCNNYYESILLNNPMDRLVHIPIENNGSIKISSLLAQAHSPVLAAFIQTKGGLHILPVHELSESGMKHALAWMRYGKVRIAPRDLYATLRTALALQLESLVTQLGRRLIGMSQMRRGSPSPSESLFALFLACYVPSVPTYILRGVIKGIADSGQFGRFINVRNLHLIPRKVLTEILDEIEPSGVSGDSEIQVVKKWIHDNDLSSEDGDRLLRNYLHLTDRNRAKTAAKTPTFILTPQHSASLTSTVDNASKVGRQATEPARFLIVDDKREHSSIDCNDILNSTSTNHANPTFTNLNLDRIQQPRPFIINNKNQAACASGVLESNNDNTAKLIPGDLAPSAAYAGEKKGGKEALIEEESTKHGSLSSTASCNLSASSCNASEKLPLFYPKASTSSYLF